MSRSLRISKKDNHQHNGLFCTANFKRWANGQKMINRFDLYPQPTTFKMLKTNRGDEVQSNSTVNFPLFAG